MTKVNLKHIVWKEGEYYVAQCLNIDVSSFGATKKEALANLTEAVELYFDGANKKTPFSKIDRPEIVVQQFRYA